MEELNIIKRLELKAELSSLKEVLDELFNDPTIAVADAATAEEMKTLIEAIKEGTATNNKISRFLEIANSLGI
jgi:hypothetical protein